MAWTRTEVAGTEGAEMMYQGLLAHRGVYPAPSSGGGQDRAGGKKLIDCGPLPVQALVTSCPASTRPLAVWSY